METWEKAKELLIGPREVEHYYIVTCKSCGRQNMSYSKSEAHKMIGMWQKCPTCGKAAAMTVHERRA